MGKPRKGIILAGGTGTRLWPVTIPTCKQLLPVYDKPMVYYPLSTLMLSGIQDILLITTTKDVKRFETLLGDGSQWGLNIQYAVQENPNGIAEAFIIGKDFIGNDPCALVLGDNIFYGAGLSEKLTRVSGNTDGATIFAYWVKNPKSFGVVELDSENRALSIQEKPENPKSNWAATGLYFYDNDVVSIVENLKPSGRGELEITDVNKAYLENKKLFVETLSRGYAWFDAGTHISLLNASEFIYTIEERQGLKVACLEEISFRMGYIDKEQFVKLAEMNKGSDYGTYLTSIMTSL